MTWQLATLEKDGKTEIVARENTGDMDREQLLDYISQLEAIIQQQKMIIESWERSVGV